MTAHSSTPPEAARRLPVALVADVGGEPRRYTPYETRAVDAAGAILEGAGLLEPGEEVTVEVGAAPAAVKVRARVTALCPDGAPGVRLAFVDLDEATRGALERMLSAAPAD
jgi:hypothetical protein